MDPITHTVLGATAAHVFTSKKLGRGAILFGAVGGFLPDIDVLWGPFISDPALPWEYHRHFTHALAFIPIGGALAAAPLLLIFKRFRPMIGWAYLAATIGWATHGLNDTLTSFGTFLYWPLSNERIAWDVISIIDPLFTVPLILGIVLALIFNRAWPTRIAFLMALAYLALGFVQNQRVLAVQEELARSRGHVIVPDRRRAMPTMANILIWRSIYEYDGALYADAVRASLFGPALVREGESIRRFTFDDLPGGDRERLERVFRSFEDFADGYVALVQENGGALLLGDVRYSLDTAGFAPLWGLRINPPAAAEPVEWVNIGAESPEARREALGELWRELVRPGAEFVPVGAARRMERVKRAQGCESLGIGKNDV